MNSNHAICPKCGASIQVNPNVEADICPSCKAAYVVETALQLYQAQMEPQAIRQKEEERYASFSMKQLLDIQSSSVFARHYPERIKTINRELYQLTGIDFQGDLPCLKESLRNIDTLLPAGILELVNHEYSDSEQKRLRIHNEEESNKWVDAQKEGRVFSPKFVFKEIPMHTEAGIYATMVSQHIADVLNDYGKDPLYLAYIYAALTTDEETKKRMSDSIALLDHHFSTEIKKHLPTVAPLFKSKPEKKVSMQFLDIMKQRYAVITDLYRTKKFKKMDEELGTFIRNFDIKPLNTYRQEHIKHGVFGVRCDSPLPTWEDMIMNSKYKERL